MDPLGCAGPGYRLIEVSQYDRSFRGAPTGQASERFKPGAMVLPARPVSSATAYMGTVPGNADANDGQGTDVRLRDALDEPATGEVGRTEGIQFTPLLPAP